MTSKSCPNDVQIMGKSSFQCSGKSKVNCSKKLYNANKSNGTSSEKRTNTDDETKLTKTNTLVHTQRVYVS